MILVVVSRGVMGLTTLLLLLAVPALWLTRLIAVGLLGAAMTWGLIEDRLQPAGAMALVGFAALALLAARNRAGWPSLAAWAALLICAAALYLRLAPGFPTWNAMGPVQIGEGAPYEKWLSFDKIGAGILLLALAVPGIYGRRNWGRLLLRATPFLVLTPVLLLATALAAGALAWDMTFTNAFLWWGTLNLLTTCMSEEALFRGLLQARLVGAAVRQGLSPHPAILLTALAFGMAHAGGGPALVLFAMLAGVGYGYAFHVTQRIEAAILCHFAVNATHFLFLTYPYPG